MGKKKDVRHQNVEVKKWTDVPAGMVVAYDTYVDIHGVLRSKKDDSCVVWHFKLCNATGIHEPEIVYDPKTNAPWCPKCWNKKKLKDYFSGSNLDSGLGSGSSTTSGGL